ncbi:hypothetical protein CL656_02270 [bacterium]|nr:hypothetical protein [bacterium]|tara:strand:- start:2551 stop:2988 length:438 start_codon:yes stop_codon:yes gene_type:complete
MFHYPIEFKLEIKNIENNSMVFSDLNSFNLSADIPKVFGGKERSLSPEDYYLFAMISCFFTTFLKLSEDKDLKYNIKNITAKSVVDRGEDSKPFVKKVFLSFNYSTDNSKNFIRLINFTKDNCFILNSVKTEFVLDFNEDSYENI